MHKSNTCDSEGFSSEKKLDSELTITGVIDHLIVLGKINYSTDILPTLLHKIENKKYYDIEKNKTDELT